MADHGMAIAHVDGKVAFVPFAAPGDLLEVAVVRRRKRHLETRLLRVLEPSPLRREPACPLFGVCGGCQWQHLPYAEQLAGKAASFQGFLKSRLGLHDDQRFRTPLAAPQEWGYRNRVGLKVRALDSVPALGFFATGSHHLVPLQHCPVAHPRINALLPSLTGFLRTWSPARDSLTQVDLQIDGDGELWSVFHVLTQPTPMKVAALEAFLRTQGVTSAWLQTGRKHTLAPLWKNAPAQMTFSVGPGGNEFQLAVSPGGFVQANPAVNQLLTDEVCALSEHYRGTTALDLYSGAGNFTLPLARDAAAVVAVEGYPPAARDAERNATRAGLAQVRVLAQPVATGLRRLAAEHCRPRFALLDPPRDGAGDAVDSLADLGPERILYISCAPPTLVRDIQRLCTRGYRVEWTRMADMFPQTAHVESLTLLRLGGGL